MGMVNGLIKSIEILMSFREKIQKKLKNILQKDWQYDNILLVVNRTFYGGIAQLGERLNGIQEVSGSIPLISTKTSPVLLL